MKVTHAAAVFIGFTLLFCWLFARPIIDGSYLAESDLYDYYLPTFLSPLTTWSTYEFAGAPTFADPENSAFYPLHLFFSHVVGSWTGYLLSAYVLGACFMYAYVHFHTGSRSAATFSGVAYGLSEAMLERLPHPNIVHVLAWLPLIVLCLDRIRLGRQRALWVTIGAIAGANCLLVGHPQLNVYVAYVCGLYAIVGAILHGGGLRYLSATAMMAVVAGLLAAIAVVPLLELTPYMARQVLDFDQFVDYSNSVPQMLSIVFPTIEHRGLEAPTYVGLGTLMLAPLGAWQLRSNWRAGFWLTVVIVALCLGAGAATPLAQVVYQLPLYDKFRIVARHLTFAAFGLSVLGGFGLAAVEQRRASNRMLVTSIAAVVAAVLGGAVVVAAWPGDFHYEHVNERWPLPIWNSTVWIQLGVAAVVATGCLGLRWWPRSGTWAVVVIVILAGDLLHGSSYPMRWNGLQAETVPPHALLPSVHAVRVGAELGPRHQRLLAPAGSLTNDLVPGTFARLWAIPTAGGYSSVMLGGIASLAMMRPNGAVERRVLSDEDASLDVLAVKYVLMKSQEMTAEEMMSLSKQGRWREVERFSTSRVTDRIVDESSRDEAEYVLLENTRALPRAWLAREVVPLSDGALFDAMRGSRLPDGRSFDPARTALVDADGLSSKRYGGDEGHVNVESIEDSSISVRVSAPAGGFLVLSEAHYPGWGAQIDGGPWRPVSRTDLALQGLEVPPGQHLVVFSFASGARRFAAGMSALGLMTLVTVWASASWRSRGVVTPALQPAERQ